MDELKVGALLRDAGDNSIVLRKAAESGRATLSFSASSEEPYERWFGIEVLDHGKGAVRMARFERGAVPLLFNHNWDDPIGMVKSASVRNGRLMIDEAELFSTARSAEVERMVNEGLRNVSVGYQIHELTEEKGEVYRATDWEPLEVSIVTVPADSTIGVGRAVDQTPRAVRVVRAVSPTAAPAASLKGSLMATQEHAAAGAVADIQVIDNGAQERLRIKTLSSLGKRHGIPDGEVEKWIDTGVNEEQAALKCLDVIAQRAKSQIKDQASHVGLSADEVKRYSLVRAIHAVVHKDWAKAGFEAEVSKTIAQRMGKSLSEHSFMIPLEVQQRVLQVGTAAQGGNLVGTDYRGDSFIDVLRNRSVAFRAGARPLPGLMGPVAIPRKTAAGAVGWVGEVGTATVNEMTIGQLTMQPRHIAGYQEFSRQLMQQASPEIEALITTDLADSIAVGLDAAVISGTGANTPTGIRFQSGLGTANPTAGTNVAYADMIRFQSTVAGANAMFGSFAYLTTPTVAAILMGKSRFTNSDTPIWEGGILDGRVVGMPAYSSLQLGTGTTLAGDFSQVLVGEWGGLEIEVNPYANFQAGIVGVRGFYTADVGVRYAAAFAVGTGMTG
ncbi:MAG: phage major capsid protein [bacterium]|jgi:HK97 family phage major capsid protein/HK97 family phage prohead protease